MQSNEVVLVITAITGAMMLWTTSIIGGVLWLNKQFSRNRQATYESAEKLRKEFGAELKRHERRLLSLEFWRVSKDGAAYFGLPPHQKHMYNDDPDERTVDHDTEAKEQF